MQSKHVRPAAGRYPSTAKGPARVTAYQPGMLEHVTPAGYRMDSSATFASMPKRRISHECGKQSPMSARPEVAICRTCGEVHEEIYTYRSTPSRIANTMSQSVSLNGWNVRRLKGVRARAHTHTPMTNAQLDLVSGCDASASSLADPRSECGPARYQCSVVALQHIGPLQASVENSAQVTECRLASLSVYAAFTETTKAGW